MYTIETVCEKPSLRFVVNVATRFFGPASRVPVVDHRMRRNTLLLEPR
jgi:hypothetical protein